MTTEVKQSYLGALNRLNKEKKKGVLVTIDGVSDSDVKVARKLVDKIIDLIPPNYFRLYKKQKGKFQMKQYWVHSPELGQIVIYDSSYVMDSIYKTKKKKYMNDIEFFEKSMAADNIDICHIVIRKNENHEIHFNNDDVFVFSDIKDYDKIITKITEVLNKVHKNVKYADDYVVAKEVDEKLLLKSGVVNIEDAKEITKKLQKRLQRLHCEMIDKGIGLNVVFQGIDAAGKSSTIRRVTKRLVPHLFNVYGISAPSLREASHHWLWRFWDKFATYGQMQIFDRSWWEQVLAQRVLNLDKAWATRFTQLNDMEQLLAKHKSYTIKFFMCIDKDTQQARFDERKSNPLKTWKVSANDEETRKKWDKYQLAFTDLLNSSDWIFIDARNKETARIEVLMKLCEYIEGLLDK